MGQIGEQVGDLRDGDFRQHRPGPFFAQEDNELALGARFGLDQHFRGLVRVQRREHGLLFIARQNFQRVGQILARQFQGLLARDGEGYDILGVVFHGEGLNIAPGN